MDLKLPKMLCKDSKQHHVMFHELNSVSSLLCIAQNVRFEIPYKVLYFETPFLMIFKYYAWASYGKDSKQHHVMFHELYSVRLRLCIAQNVRFEIPYKVLYFETPFLMIFKYYAWASYGYRRTLPPSSVGFDRTEISVQY